MAAPIPLRTDYDGATLRGLAKASTDANQTRHLLALAAIYDGGRRGDAARVGAVGLQVIRDWVLPFNADGQDRLVDDLSATMPAFAPATAAVLSALDVPEPSANRRLWPITAN